MSTDTRDRLETLRAELDFIEKGGYGRPVREPWKPTSVFQGSLSCINYGYTYRAHPCSACLLDDFVPEGRHAAPVPCHHIPLDAEGMTVEAAELEDQQSLLEEKVKAWLRAQIKEIEDARVGRT
ncbi:MAG TPA: hypothetical protein VF570_00705 [Pyrinomonadaceae bacterium]|jgi:hypothetical protein